jgi:hypothetical protein
MLCEDQWNAWIRHRYGQSTGIRIMMNECGYPSTCICNPDHGWSMSLTDSEIQEAFAFNAPKTPPKSSFFKRLFDTFLRK